jgi:hypothetical protein
MWIVSNEGHGAGQSYTARLKISDETQIVLGKVVRCMSGEKNVNSGLHTVLVTDEIGNPGW